MEHVKKTTIFGAPGCGKTHYLLDLLEELLKVYRPDEIAYVSFTRKGSYEGKQRAMKRFGYSTEELPYFRTLHSIAFANAGIQKSDIITKDNYREFSDIMGLKFTGYYTEDFNSEDDRLLFYYFLLKNNPTTAESIENEINMGQFEKVSKGYERFKEQRGLIDYTDMLMFFLESNQAVPVKVAIIDEAQDLTALQWKMCDIAFRECEHVYIAGDDDQAIYEWNGSDVNTFLNLDGERVILEKSYRMPSELVRFSKHITDNIDNRVEKHFAPRSEGGNVFIYNHLNEISFKKNESYYLLARTNYHLSRYREHLMDSGIVFNDRGNSSVSQRVVKAIVAYEHFRKYKFFEDRADELLVNQLVIDKDNIKEPWYHNFDLPVEVLNYYRDLIADKVDLKDDRFLISTIHGVKGGEADNVVLFLDMTRNIQNSYYRYKDAELRTLYVGCTRARKNLHLIHSQTKIGYDDYLDFEKFLYETGTSLKGF